VRDPVTRAPGARAAGEAAVPAPRAVPLFGIDILDATSGEALALLQDALAGRRPPSTCYFVNAHTLELASADTRYRSVLRSADLVFGDGTGVRWAVRLSHGLRLRDNVNGTDLVPALLSTSQPRRLRFFLLGAAPGAIERAAEAARSLFPDWELAGFHHGYLDAEASSRALDRIARAGPDLLLVGMGNPLQELWIDEHRKRLEVPLCIGVGGLFDYWAGDLDRAPAWMRRLGIEWLHLMWRQPRKVRRYLVGGPFFLARVLGRDRFARRRRV
jgi:N-acetylglucosaminyldiphosphoundecaprenol N-acetyl-beta-D-mannosaminyltransferase